MANFFVIDPEGKLVPQAAPAAPSAPQTAAQGWLNPPQSDLFKSLEARYAQPDVELQEAQRRDVEAHVGAKMVHGVKDPLFRAAGLGPVAREEPHSMTQDVLARRAALAQRMGLDKAVREEATAQQDTALKQAQAVEARDPSSGISNQARATARVMLGILRQGAISNGADTQAIDSVIAGLDQASAEQLRPWVELYERAGLAQGQLALQKATVASARGTHVEDKLGAWHAKVDVPGFRFRGREGLDFPNEVAQKAFVEAASEQATRMNRINHLVDTIRSAEAGKTSIKEVHEAYKLLVQGEMQSSRARMNPAAMALIEQGMPELVDLQSFAALWRGGSKGVADSLVKRFAEYGQLQGREVVGLAAAAGYDPIAAAPAAAPASGRAPGAVAPAVPPAGTRGTWKGKPVVSDGKKWVEVK